jgi:Predicted periplasmic lipoprotein (DUF2279)
MRNILFSISILITTNVYGSTLSDSVGTINKKRLWLVAGTEASFYVGGMLYLSEIWYRDYERVPFHWYNDNSGYLQMDKLAHSFIAYQESRAGYHALRWAGVPKNKALLWGGSLGFILQLPVEVFDGIYEGYGFSMGDVVANTSGSLLFTMQEWQWDEQRIKMKYSFSPSPYAKVRPRVLGENAFEQLFLDYNSHTYWLSVNLKSFAKNSNLPAWLNVALGYSGNGMLGEFENPDFINGQPAPYYDRYRQVLLSLDVDLSKIQTRSIFLKRVLGSLNLLKIPFPAIEFNNKGVKAYGLYY